MRGLLFGQISLAAGKGGYWEEFDSRRAPEVVRGGADEGILTLPEAKKNFSEVSFNGGFFSL